MIKKNGADIYIYTWRIFNSWKCHATHFHTYFNYKKNFLFVFFSSSFFFLISLNSFDFRLFSAFFKMILFLFLPSFFFLFINTLHWPFDIADRIHAFSGNEQLLYYLTGNKNYNIKTTINLVIYCYSIKWW